MPYITRSVEYYTSVGSRYWCPNPKYYCGPDICDHKYDEKDDDSYIDPSDVEPDDDSLSDAESSEKDDNTALFFN